jgi:hypothetical protein
VYPNSTDKLSGHILRLKISIKLLIHIGSKTLSLRDNQQKPKNNYIRSEFLGFCGVISALNGGRNFDNFCKLYKAPFYFCTFHQKIRPDSFCCVEIFSRLSRKVSIFDPICIKSFMLIFDHRICPESLSVEFGYTLYIILFVWLKIDR